MPPLERLQATFLLSAPGLKQCPQDNLPEIAFAGRSNAGKSSVLNCITGNRRTAKVSKTPGRTQLLNFFDIHLPGQHGATCGRIVDLPGYGYAKAGKQAQAQWQQSVNAYLSRRDNLVGVVLVMDIRHPNQSFDQELFEWAAASDLPILGLLNKADKLGRGAQQKALHELNRLYKDQAGFSSQTFSATKNTGREALVAYVLAQLDASQTLPGEA